jgi:hypothetical protein
VTIPIPIAIALILDRLPRSVEYGDDPATSHLPDYYPGIRGMVGEVLRGWRGSRAWRDAVVATAFRG